MEGILQGTTVDTGRQLALRKQREQELKDFLAAQAQQNPRLRKQREPIPDPYSTNKSVLQNSAFPSANLASTALTGHDPAAQSYAQRERESHVLPHSTYPSTTEQHASPRSINAPSQQNAAFSQPFAQTATFPSNYAMPNSLLPNSSVLGSSVWPYGTPNHLLGYQPTTLMNPNPYLYAG
jgi:hypothetical protein